MELTLYSQLCFAVSILKKSLSKAGSELGQGPGPPLNIYQLVHRKSGDLHLFTEQMNPLHLILIFFLHFRSQPYAFSIDGSSGELLAAAATETETQCWMFDIR